MVLYLFYLRPEASPHRTAEAIPAMTIADGD